MTADGDGRGGAMAWAKIDDGYFEHTKVVAAGRDARDLHLAAICYCSRNLTDGFVPEAALPVVAAHASVARARALADRLVALRLFDPAEGGYAVHDYLDYNPSRESVLTNRAKRAEAGRAGGMQKASNARGKTPAEGRQDGSDPPGDSASKTPSKLLANGLADAKQNGSKSLPRPLTYPDGYVTSSSYDDDAPSGSEPEPEAPPEPTRAHPFALVEALCEELGADVSDLGRGDRGKQAAVAKRLVENGVDADELRRAVRWLRSQEWVTAGVDLLLVEKQLAKWRLAGRPAAATRRPRSQADHNAARQNRVVL